MCTVDWGIEMALYETANNITGVWDQKLAPCHGHQVASVIFHKCEYTFQYRTRYLILIRSRRVSLWKQKNQWDVCLIHWVNIVVVCKMDMNPRSRGMSLQRYIPPPQKHLSNPSIQITTTQTGKNWLNYPKSGRRIAYYPHTSILYIGPSSSLSPLTLRRLKASSSRSAESWSNRQLASW